MTAVFSYIGTTTDYFVVLLLLFGKYQSRKETKPVIVGAYIGNALLVLVSLAIALLLQQVPAEWLLGLLGLIPIYMGIKSYLSDEDEGDEIEERLNNIQPKNILKDVILITFAAVVQITWRYIFLILQQFLLLHCQLFLPYLLLY